MIAVLLLVCLKIIASHLDIAPNWLTLLDDKTVSYTSAIAIACFSSAF
ncbi:hypothetical protein [Rheinheimera oceanensis]|nr:hypothetical protein [Rheinheimera oceanensis]